MTALVIYGPHNSAVMQRNARERASNERTKKINRAYRPRVCGRVKRPRNAILIAEHSRLRNLIIATSVSHVFFSVLLSLALCVTPAPAVQSVRASARYFCLCESESTQYPLYQLVCVCMDMDV